MFDLIAGVVAWFYSLWPSYGFAIIMLTLTVMIVVTPLTLKGTRSMLQMQLLQPELKRIQSKYGPGERQQMNEELMAFYQENGINPLGGCLPLLVQLPVFLVLFRVVSGMTRRATDLGTQLGWTAARDLDPPGPYDEEILDQAEHVFDPEYIGDSTELYADLTETNEMPFVGIDLSRTASDVFGESVLEFLPYLALIVVVLVSSLIQQRQIQGRNTGAQVNPQQQAIMRVMPYFLPVFSFAMPAALVVYFVVSNLYRIAQQAYITHSLYGGDDSLGAQLAHKRTKGGDDAPAKADGKGRPTPKRNEAQKRGGSSRGRNSKTGGRGGRTTRSSTRSRSASGSKGRDDGSGGRASSAKAKKATKDRASGKQPSGESATGPARGGGSKGKSKKKDGGSSRRGSARSGSPPKKGKSTGAGRTGRAPTRHIKDS